MRRRLAFAFLISMALVALGRSGWTAGTPEEVATNEAKTWLALVDQGKHGESWDGAAKLFKNAVTREKWNETLAGIRDPLGKVISRKVKTAKLTETDGKYVVIQFDTSFERKKKAIETVTPMQEADGSWRVSGYFIK